MRYGVEFSVILRDETGVTPWGELMLSFGEYRLRESRRESGVGRMLADCPDSRLCAVGHTKFFIDAGYVGLDRVAADR